MPASGQSPKVEPLKLRFGSHWLKPVAQPEHCNRHPSRATESEKNNLRLRLKDKNIAAHNAEVEADYREIKDNAFSPGLKSLEVS